MFDIEQWVFRQFGSVIQYGGNPPTDLRIDCPFCLNRYGKVDEGHKLYISLVKRTCHCFRCGYSRSWVGLVSDVMRVGFIEACAELYVVPKISDFDKLEPEASEHSIATHCGDGAKLPHGFVSLMVASHSSTVILAKKYLLSRGFGKRYWARYSLGVSEDLPYRVIIPIEHQFWQARALFKWQWPKYLSPKGFGEARQVLFNGEALRRYTEIVVCEGAFSAMKVGDNAIALLRKKATVEQLERIAISNAKRVIVALDSDAELEAIELSSTLRRKGKEVVLWLFTDGDPADRGEFEIMPFDFKVEVETRLRLG